MNGVISSNEEGHTWDVLHKNTSRLSALILLEISQSQPHYALAVFPQQLQRKWYITQRTPSNCHVVFVRSITQFCMRSQDVKYT